MIRHQAKPERPRRQPLVRRNEQVNERDVIFFIVEDSHASVSAVQHVIANAADGGPGSSWHSRSVSRPELSVNKVECPLIPLK